MDRVSCFVCATPFHHAAPHGTVSHRTANLERPISFFSLVRRAKVFWQFLPLGVVAYGGPTAHIALLHERFVDKSQWLTEEQFVELMAVGQGLPGPTSTQVGFGVRVARLKICQYRIKHFKPRNRRTVREQTKPKENRTKRAGPDHNETERN